MSERLRQLAQPVMIRASAGAGKTFQLTNRLIALLAEGEQPHRILATTFTRKAAGEIRDRVLERLADAATNPKKLNELKQHVHPDLTAARAVSLLRGLIVELHRLNFRTLDSFFVSIVQSFALDLGLSPALRVIFEQDSEDVQLRRDAIAAALEDDDRDRTLTLLRRLTAAPAARPVHRMIEQVVDGCYQIYRQTPEEAWDRLQPPAPLAQERLFELLGAIAEADLPRTQAGALDKRFKKAWMSAMQMVREGDWKTFISKGLGKNIASGETTYHDKPMPESVVSVLDQWVHHARAMLLKQLSERTRATHQLMQRFDHHYRQSKRRAGAMTFSDVTELLAAGSLAGRLDEIYYRLDGHIAHLLLDEFQDTSIDQWRIIEPIAEEVLAVSDASKTFLCVGDVKQAIYGWRGGVAEIFNTLRKQWPQIEEQPIAETYRCRQAVVDAVNAVFGHLSTHALLAGHSEVVKQWAGQYQRHRAAQDDAPGFVQMSVCEAADDREGADRSNLTFDAAVQRIASIHRKHSGATIGVLVRQKKFVQPLIYRLRHLDPPIFASGESGNALTDSPAVAVVLSLLRLADHPADQISAYHVRHSPLGPIVGLEEINDAAAQRVAAETRHALMHHGLGPTLWQWVEQLAGHCDRRDLNRLMQLVDLAHRFEDRFRCRVIDFVRHVEQVRVEDASGSPVRVMTIHQSKGLQFDAVVLPELDVPLARVDSRQPLIDRSAPTAAPHRVCCYAGEALRDLSDELTAMHEQAAQRSLRESLSVLYVAMTRARFALHMIIRPPSSSEKKIPSTFAGLLRCAFSEGGAAAPGEVLYQRGDPDWLEHLPAGEAPHRPAAPPRPVLAEPSEQRSRVLIGRSPSELAGESGVRLADRLRLHDDPAALRGTVVHAWFERVGWLDDGPPDRESLRAAAAAQGAPDEQLDAWLDDFFSAVRKPDIREALQRSTYADDARLYRERRFVVRDGDTLISGAIDRLVVMADCAVVLDYKTDAVDDDPTALREKADPYRPQIEAYRGAAAQLTGLPLDAIEARLLFTTPGRAVDL